MMDSSRPKRTAVLVVHGMGSQRPMSTVRGIVEAVWLDKDEYDPKEKRFWMHPEESGNDIDLLSITTKKTDEFERNIDFHELYWAHLMSETKAVAVLLWLFELVRKGPKLKREMRALWWGAATFLAFAVLSVAYLAILLIDRFARIDAAPQILGLEPLMFLWIVAGYSLMVAVRHGAFRLGRRLALAISILSLLLALYFFTPDPCLALIAKLTTPLLLTAIVVRLLMGRWGLKALGVAFGLSWGLYGLFLLIWITGLWFASEQLPQFQGIPDAALPWSLSNDWSVVAACLFVVVYLALNAVFLQPFVGDAARYFRNSPANVAVRREIRQQAVNMLEHLHLCGNYDRIIVVAHSLGTVVAYDMLRNYFGRICRNIPCEPDEWGEIFRIADSEKDQSAANPEVLRACGRKIIAEIAKRIATPAKKSSEADDGQKAWLVTDFVTLGSPLTHAQYLMCDGESEEGLQWHFEQRVKEREFPICPPRFLDDDGRLTFRNPPDTGEPHFHHGALFGLTRWTNLYFPMSELLWGDAIGGPLKEKKGKAGKKEELFGSGVGDVEVYTLPNSQVELFTHTAYWDTKRRDGRAAPHINELRTALDLRDKIMRPTSA